MFDRLLQEPVLGLGLGIDVHSAEPNWRRLLDVRRGRFDFLEVYTRGETDSALQVVEATGGELPILYHHENLDPAWPGGAAAESVAAAAANVELLGARWCVEELATRQVDGRYLDFFMPALLTPASIAGIVDNIMRLQGELDCPLVPENPPYQLAVGAKHVLELLGELAVAARCGVVLDLGHLYSFQLCAGLEPLAGFDALPHEHVVEVHVAGARIEDRNGVALYQDLHGAAEIPPVLFEMLDEVVPRLPNLKAITIEVEDASDEFTLVQTEQVASRPAVQAWRERVGGR